ETERASQSIDRHQRAAPAIPSRLPPASLAPSRALPSTLPELRLIPAASRLLWRRTVRLLRRRSRRDVWLRLRPSLVNGAASGNQKARERGPFFIRARSNPPSPARSPARLRQYPCRGRDRVL